MTPAQLNTFKTDILANQSANAAAGNHGLIVDYYNAAGSGSIWKPSVTVQAMNAVIDWSAFAGLTVAKQNTYLAMITSGEVDATSSTVRAGFVTIFGNGAASTVALSALAQRTPTRFEQLFTSNSVTSMFGYTVTVDDVVVALNS